MPTPSLVASSQCRWPPRSALAGRAVVGLVMGGVFTLGALLCLAEMTYDWSEYA